MKTLCSPLWWLLCKFENGAMVVAGSWKAALYCGSVFVINYLAFLCPCSAADLILEFINFHINTACWIESAILIAAAFLVDEKLLLWLKANTHGRIGTPVRNNLEITSYPVDKKKLVRVRSTTQKKLVELWLAAMSLCRAPICRLSSLPYW